jgi:Asp-tRNA(Asn)/Glu-tRNA(Gln) amidotransferase A subunit family amidase
VSAAGLSFYSIGSIARRAADCLVILEAIRDEAPASGRTGAGFKFGKRVRIGVDALTAAVDPGQEDSFSEVLRGLERAGAAIVEQPLRHYRDVVAANYVTC